MSQIKGKAPWTPEQVAALNAWQQNDHVHEFTCGKNSAHVLVATEQGWICPSCDYTQDWAHDFMMKQGTKITASRAASKAASAGSNPASPAKFLRMREGWMDSITFDHEVGEALGGRKVYSSEADLREHHKCIQDTVSDNIGDSVSECRAQRVYVVDAESFDTFIAHAKEKLSRHGAEDSITGSHPVDTGSNPVGDTNS